MSSHIQKGVSILNVNALVMGKVYFISEVRKSICTLKQTIFQSHWSSLQVSTPISFFLSVCSGCVIFQYYFCIFSKY